MGCSFVNGNCCGHDEQMITKQSKAFVRRSRGNRSRKKLMTKFSRKMCVWAGSRRRRQKRESAKSGNKDVALLTPIPLIFIKTSPREQEKNINQLILHQTLLASGLYFGDIGSPSWKTFTKASGAERHRDSDSNNSQSISSANGIGVHTQYGTEYRKSINCFKLATAKSSFSSSQSQRKFHS